MKTPVKSLDARAKAVWRDLLRREPRLSACSATAVESYCVQIVRMRDAQARVDEEGELVAGSRERPEPHPALAIERAAANEVRAWLKYLQLELASASKAKTTTGVPAARSAFDELAERRAGAG